MGLRHPPSPVLINRSTITNTNHDENNRSTNSNSNPNPNRRFHSSSMVTNYTKSNLIEMNSQSDESCLVVISSKVYDLTLWIEDQSLSPSSSSSSCLDSNSIHQLRHLSKIDPLHAGNWLIQRLGSHQIHLIDECRIGDFDSFEHQALPILRFPDSLDPGGGGGGGAGFHSNWSQNFNRNSNQTESNHNSITDHPSTPSTSTQAINTVEPNCTNPNQSSLPISSSTPTPRRSHLSRALALVEYHKSLVIEAEANVGSAHISLSEAFEGLAEAEKKRDHLVMLACEGFRPTLPEWESLEDEDGFGTV
ncbi:uncharacterized protein MELLADRAFT_79796 [Melampsora larici-populina 98AG31]|uniref:Uncharacterized protein n=1 Tax=Melampsora larici-populina (strain 98AG31 / pathotype 3-4-7) TaxID=747676 RepID=F4SBY0_MELLP|nr:uncharacterized protein MELLADRAFT_79796 [Melampsora larici-populina 98AG31]EGF97850.1 hypothetical protein MELLADRAFT_79796 [Melampsora larici-populina 98AG31]